MTLVQECNYEPPHSHEFPDDWIFSGPNGWDPRGDLRWKPSSYEYLDNKLRVIHTTSIPFCDDEALDRFTAVADYGAAFNPVYIQVRRPDRTVEILPWEYRKSTDTLHPLEG
jgi:hypothetical protein